mmetsp:Transcript_642/g.1530  ORF Transcript_642/g.1530 Transcript_642/m.1530 type:complete len:224 (-) Transcript_642:2176-2847(-)
MSVRFLAPRTLCCRDILKLRGKCRLDRSDPLRAASTDEEKGKVYEGLRHHGDEVHSLRAPEDRDIIVCGSVNARLDCLVKHYAHQEDADKGYEADSLTHTVDEESPAVNVQSLSDLVMVEECDEDAVHRRYHRKHSHEDMDHEQLNPEEECAPCEDDSRPWLWDGHENPWEVLIEVDELAEAQGMALCLQPSSHERLEEAVSFWSVVQDREKDRCYLEAPAGG